MKRVSETPRENWQSTVEQQGLIYGTPARDARGDNRNYWDESVSYVFTMDEILNLEATVEVMHSMCMQAVERVVLTERFADFGIPEYAWEAIKASYHRGDQHVYGRFDFRYDGHNLPKLLEYNADTPTSLLEASIIQWYWLKDKYPELDQWNSLHESLVDRWKHVKEHSSVDTIHFAWSQVDPSGEDHITTTYLQETATEAGFTTVGLHMENIGWDEDLRRFSDLSDAPMETTFKLYPWEFMFDDDFGRYVIEALPENMWIEPLWKCILSNKAILAVLWEMFPGHPNLLPAYLDDPGMLTEYIKKPKLGREGANMSIVGIDKETSTTGVYGAEGYVYQMFDPLPEFEGYRPVIGTWVVGDEAAGMGIRESAGLITDDGAAFIPHRIEN